MRAFQVNVVASEPPVRSINQILVTLFECAVKRGRTSRLGLFVASIDGTSRSTNMVAAPHRREVLVIHSAHALRKICNPEDNMAVEVLLQKKDRTKWR